MDKKILFNIWIVKFGTFWEGYAIVKAVRCSEITEITDATYSCLNDNSHMQKASLMLID